MTALAGYDQLLQSRYPTVMGQWQDVAAALASELRARMEVKPAPRVKAPVKPARVYTVAQLRKLTPGVALVGFTAGHRVASMAGHQTDGSLNLAAAVRWASILSEQHGLDPAGAEVIATWPDMDAWLASNEHAGYQPLPAAPEANKAWWARARFDFFAGMEARQREVDALPTAHRVTLDWVAAGDERMGWLGAEPSDLMAAAE